MKHQALRLASLAFCMASLPQCKSQSKPDITVNKITLCTAMNTESNSCDEMSEKNDEGSPIFHRPKEFYVTLELAESEKNGRYKLVLLNSRSGKEVSSSPEFNARITSNTYKFVFDKNLSPGGYDINVIGLETYVKNAEKGHLLVKPMAMLKSLRICTQVDANNTCPERKGTAAPTIPAGTKEVFVAAEYEAVFPGEQASFLVDNGEDFLNAQYDKLNLNWQTIDTLVLTEKITFDDPLKAATHYLLLLNRTAGDKETAEHKMLPFNVE